MLLTVMDLAPQSAGLQEAATYALCNICATPGTVLFRDYRVRNFRGRVSNFNQSEARKHCFLASDWLKFETLPRKFRTLLVLGSCHETSDISFYSSPLLMSIVLLHFFVLLTVKYHELSFCECERKI